MASVSAANRVETVVIGAGVIGLAIARALAIRGKEILLVDRASRIGSEASSRNSEVIHAGLYYPTDSLKARFCVRGKSLLYRFCSERSILYNRCGKLVVATNEDQMQTTVKSLQEQAEKNGVHDTRLLAAEEVKAMEPHVVSHGALWSPSTGALDSHAFMTSLLTDAEENGCTLALHTELEDGAILGDRAHLQAGGMWLSCKSVINSAGLWADRIADKIHANHSWRCPRQYFAKGTYFRLQQTSPFQRLVYPIPDRQGGLGVHATIDSGGQVKFGPDVEWLHLGADPDQINWKPDAERARSFYVAIRTFWPQLPDDSLFADYIGVRPKLSHPTLVHPIPFQDFCILGPETHGVSGLFHLLGMESPGLTSSLAIAEHIALSIDGKV